MKKIIFALGAAALLTACQKPQGPTQWEYDQLLAQRDSIGAQLTELQDIIGGVTTSLDSIDTQEGLIFVANEDGSKATKRQIMERIQSYKDLLQRQREQLEQLEKQQGSNRANIKELKTIIGRLRQDIYEKEQRISELEQELSTSKKDIADLQQNLAESRNQTATAAGERDALQQVATAQDEMLNTGYYVVGTKSVLKDMGLIKGFFKKKADYANLDKTQFTKVDIREFTQLHLNCKTPKLITEKPASSYSITDNGDGSTTLQIADPAAFWSASPFLIIQIK